MHIRQGILVVVEVVVVGIVALLPLDHNLAEHIAFAVVAFAAVDALDNHSDCVESSLLHCSHALSRSTRSLGN